MAVNIKLYGSTSKDSYLFVKQSLSKSNEGQFTASFTWLKGRIVEGMMSIKFKDEFKHEILASLSKFGFKYEQD
jgi:hypothetical protein